MTESRLVFSNGDWIDVALPKGYDPNWTTQDTYYYATIWALASRKGFSRQKARQLAEAAVSKRIYPGILFYSQIEKDLLSLDD